MSRFVALLTLVSLCGCSGTLTSKNLDPAEATKVGSSYNGVIVYPNAWFIEQSKTTTLTKDGKIVGREVDKTCTPVQTERLATHVDYSRPTLLSYSPGLLETYTFGPTMTDEGALKSLNVVSTPDQGTTLKNLGAAATSFAGVAALRPLAPPDACNEGLVLMGLKRYSIP